MVAKKFSQDGVNVPIVNKPGDVTTTKLPVVKEQISVTCVGMENEASNDFAKKMSSNIIICRVCLFIGINILFFTCVLDLSYTISYIAK
jgi:hypothetical protein